VSIDGGEFDYINWIRGQTRSHDAVPLGIGDDAAAVRIPSADDCLVAVDMLMEGTHFTIPAASAEQIGRKALAVNLSDIAAMAGRPTFALVSVALNRRHGNEFAQKLFVGLKQLADEFDVALIGGDTNIWDGPLVISVTVMGEATGSGSVTRSDAQIGDWILATGRFGGSLVGKQFTFQPRVREALELQHAVSLHAMIDVSDGLAADLLHILDESKVGAILNADAIPISDAARMADDGRSPLAHALADGEDFELLFTVTADEGRRLIDNPPVAVELTKIGEIVEARTRVLIDEAGQQLPLTRTGWEHSF
jgi:thiamine-monophosphate kinase